jgi:hypothetical protein
VGRTPSPGSSTRSTSGCPSHEAPAPPGRTQAAGLDAAGAEISCYGASTAVSVVEAAEAAGLPVVVTLVDGKFADQRVYVDNAPVVAALG